MKEEYKKYLPIGTIAKLKKSEKKVMITGYAQIDISTADKIYDYSGCMFPEGIISNKKTILFNHDDIEKLICIGYSNDEQKEFSDKLNELLTEENIKKILEETKNKIANN